LQRTAAVMPLLVLLMLLVGVGVAGISSCKIGFSTHL
jgi:hypothetical protein